MLQLVHRFRVMMTVCRAWLGIPFNPANMIGLRELGMASITAAFGVSAKASGRVVL